MNGLKADESAVAERASAQKRTAMFGGISLAMFCAGAVVAFVMGQAGSGLSGEDGLGAVVGAGFLFVGGSVLATLSGVVSLWRREIPRWPAVTGLALSAIPVAYALLCVLIFAYAILTQPHR